MHVYNIQYICGIYIQCIQYTIYIYIYILSYTFNIKWKKLLKETRNGKGFLIYLNSHPKDLLKISYEQVKTIKRTYKFHYTDNPFKSLKM